MLITTFARTLITSTFVIGAITSLAAPIRTSWRYYRPGNTGIQGDTNPSICVGADQNPWIAGYNGLAEEGGFARFVVAQNRWENISNVDYAVLGSANEIGYDRVSDMILDAQGNLWIGTWRGLLRMSVARGPSSLKRFGPDNSPLPGGVTRDLSLAPDGSIWVSASGAEWAPGGLSRYQPSTNSWTNFSNRGGDKIAVQPKPSGGYYVWTSGEGFTPMERYDSTSGTWTVFTTASGQPAHLASNDSVDAAGRMWLTRWFGNQGQEVVDCLLPNGTWVSPPLPPPHPVISVAALRAFGNNQLLFVDGYMQLWRFNNGNWSNLGSIPHSGFIDDMDIDSAGTVWLCGSGVGGTLRRDAITGNWQRYRVTNTSQFDFFNLDLAISPQTGEVFATANANSDTGGMVKFDGIRWTGFVTQLGYGLTGPWPFAGSPQSEAVYVRPSNGRVVANPINGFTHEFNGATWAQLPGGPDQIRQYVEDSLGRLWAIPHYGGLGVFLQGGYIEQGMTGWGQGLKRDPSRPGTVWAVSESEVVRTDGAYRFSRTPGDIPNIGANFSGLAVAADGSAWVGSWSVNSADDDALVRLNANTGVATVIFRKGVNWPFPGDHVQPRLVTPDGRLWMTYDSEFPGDHLGLLWYDGSQIGVYPGPAGGAWVRGGLPSGIISDIEYKPIQNGYELWMTCASRGIAVLTVKHPGAPNPNKVP